MASLCALQSLCVAPQRAPRGCLAAAAAAPRRPGRASRRAPVAVAAAAPGPRAAPGRLLSASALNRERTLTAVLHAVESACLTATLALLVRHPVSRRKVAGVGVCTLGRALTASPLQAVQAVQSQRSAAAASAGVRRPVRGAARAATAAAPLVPPFSLASLALPPSLPCYPLLGALLSVRPQRKNKRFHPFSSSPLRRSQHPDASRSQGALLRRLAASAAAQTPHSLRGASQLTEAALRLEALETATSALGGAVSDVANDLQRTRSKLRLARRSLEAPLRAAASQLARQQEAQEELVSSMAALSAVAAKQFTVLAAAVSKLQAKAEREAEGERGGEEAQVEPPVTTQVVTPPQQRTFPAGAR